MTFTAKVFKVFFNTKGNQVQRLFAFLATYSFLIPVLQDLIFQRVYVP